MRKIGLRTDSNRQAGQTGSCDISNIQTFQKKYESNYRNMKIIQKKYENISEGNIGLDTGCSSQTDSCDNLNVQIFHFASKFHSVHKLGNVKTVQKKRFFCDSINQNI